jgi:DNA-binding LacI/PurR family transcriptional regulator
MLLSGRNRFCKTDIRGTSGRRWHTITDLVAVGVSYFNDNKIKVPQQVAVIGFSNWFMSQVLTPKLSTVDQPSHLMASRLLIYYWKK